jgi:type VI protein secretion system component Hcp
MADTCYLALKIADSDAPSEHGHDNTRREMGAENVEADLEVLEFRAAVGVGSSRTADARATAARTWEPAEFVLRHGKATPLLLQALRQNERIDLSLRMFTRNFDTGATELETTFEIAQGRIVYFEMENPNALNPETANSPPSVRIKVIPHTVRVISALGTEVEDMHTVG